MTVLINTLLNSTPSPSEMKTLLAQIREGFDRPLPKKT